MEDIISVVYELTNGYSGEIKATDETEAIEFARDFYEQTNDCDYVAAMKNGEVLREWGW